MSGEHNGVAILDSILRFFTTFDGYYDGDCDFTISCWINDTQYLTANNSGSWHPSYYSGILKQSFLHENVNTTSECYYYFNDYTLVLFQCQTTLSIKATVAHNNTAVYCESYIESNSYMYNSTRHSTPVTIVIQGMRSGTDSPW